MKWVFTCFFMEFYNFQLKNEKFRINVKSLYNLTVDILMSCSMCINLPLNVFCVSFCFILMNWWKLFRLWTNIFAVSWYSIVLLILHDKNRSQNKFDIELCETWASCRYRFFCGLFLKKIHCCCCKIAIFVQFFKTKVHVLIRNDLLWKLYTV